MINISDKINTLRTATAISEMKISAEARERLEQNDLPKKDVLPIARAAAVMAVKKTPEIIPYCHNFPIDGVVIDYEIADEKILIRSTVTSIWRTGVEMEALIGASIAALTIYDMLKPVDKNIEILCTKLQEKKGGKSDYIEKISDRFKAAVIVTSDGTYAGKREDNSGKLILARLQKLGVVQLDYTILPDDEEQIKNCLLDKCQSGFDLILTTGGTGLGPRDVTVEATAKVIERDMPAVMQAMRSFGQDRTPYAMLSRGLAGVRGKTVIVNFPGSSRGTSEGLSAIFPSLLHVFKMMRGGGH